MEAQGVHLVGSRLFLLFRAGTFKNDVKFYENDDLWNGLGFYECLGKP